MNRQRPGGSDEVPARLAGHRCQPELSGRAESSLSEADDSVGAELLRRSPEYRNADTGVLCSQASLLSQQSPNTMAPVSGVLSQY